MDNVLYLPARKARLNCTILPVRAELQNSKIHSVELSKLKFRNDFNFATIFFVAGSFSLLGAFKFK